MNGYKYLMLILSLNKVIYLSCNIFFANDRWIVGLQQANPDGLLVLRRHAADSRTEYEVTDDISSIAVFCILLENTAGEKRLHH